MFYRFFSSSVSLMMPSLRRGLTGCAKLAHVDDVAVEGAGTDAARSSGLATIEWRFTARLFIGAAPPPQGGSQPDQVGDLLGQAR
ncbi:hypothetical protein [Nonomuraea sp. CA-141351]|uniref:hypothetical protein n=1 Tax=Nonomuraea sp. CA-141351 TaxID=3239996 RepID=UPI003D9286CB